jgi:uncharacterized protein
MKKLRTPNLAKLSLAAMAIACGCSVLAPQTDRSRYFVLSPSAGSDSISQSREPRATRPLMIGLGPITIPNYLNRPEVVTRLSDTEFAVSDTDRWGEPLEANLSRVLSQDLTTDLPGLQVTPFPWSRRAQLDYRISVDFRHLERTADGNAEVEAQWTVRTSVENKLVDSGTTTISLPAGNDPRSASASLSQGIARVSLEIAQALQKQSRPLPAT